MQIKVLRKDDGYWLSIDGQKKALINLDIHGEIVTTALEEAAQTVRRAMKIDYLYLAYNEAAIKYFGEFARLNEIPE